MEKKMETIIGDIWGLYRAYTRIMRVFYRGFVGVMCWDHRFSLRQPVEVFAGMSLLGQVALLGGYMVAVGCARAVEG